DAINQRINHHDSLTRHSTLRRRERHVGKEIVRGLEDRLSERHRDGHGKRGRWGWGHRRRTGDWWGRARRPYCYQRRQHESAHRAYPGDGAAVMGVHDRHSVAKVVIAPTRTQRVSTEHRDVSGSYQRWPLCLLLQTLAWARDHTVCLTDADVIM